MYLLALASLRAYVLLLYLLLWSPLLMRFFVAMPSCRDSPFWCTVRGLALCSSLIYLASTWRIVYTLLLLPLLLLLVMLSSLLYDIVPPVPSICVAAIATAAANRMDGI